VVDGNKGVETMVEECRGMILARLLGRNVGATTKPAKSAKRDEGSR